MRILLDECVPRGLRRAFPGHDVRTVPEMGWSGTRNGELLKLIASEKFDVFLSVDQNLKHQQNLQALPFAIIVLVAPTNRLAELLPLVPSVLSALPTIQSGTILEIT